MELKTIVLSRRKESSLEINISGLTQRKLTKMFANKLEWLNGEQTEEELVYVFE